MNIGLTWEKLLIVGVIAALIIGPERLPRYAEALARFVKQGGEYLRGARTRLKDEMGEEFDEVDWRKLDPRQYDPRRIIREALIDDAPAARPAAVATMTAGPPSPRGGSHAYVAKGDDLPPFDDEAT